MLLHAKRTKKPRLTRDRLRTPHPLEKEGNPVEAEVDVVDVAAPVVGALPAVVLLVLVAVTAIIPTLIAVLLHHLLRTVTHPSPLIPGVNQLRPLLPMPTQAGTAPRTPKLEHGVAALKPPGVQLQLLMARQLPLLLSNRSLFLRLDPLSRLPPPPSFHSRKSPGAYSLFLRSILNFISFFFVPQCPRKTTSHCYFERFPTSTSPFGASRAPRTPSRAYPSPCPSPGT